MTAPEKFCRAYRISGRVQGVGYRAFARQCAEELGLTGWVRNSMDGDVEAEACGDKAALESFEEKLRRGPSYGRVDGLSVREIPETEYPGFQIRS